jgi:hypothetical protein
MDQKDRHARERAVAVTGPATATRSSTTVAGARVDAVLAKQGAQTYDLDAKPSDLGLGAVVGLPGLPTRAGRGAPIDGMPTGRGT